MSSSAEYLASLGIDTSDIDNAVNQTMTLLGHLGEHFDSLSKNTERAGRAFTKTGSEANKAASDIKKINSAADDGSDGWQKLKKDLDDAAAAYREFRQESLVEGGTPNAGADVSGMTRSRQQELLEIYRASTASIVSELTKREQQEQQVTQGRADDARRVADVSAQHWINAEERRAAETKRVSDVAAQAYIAAEEKKAATSKRVADVSARAWIDAEEEKARAAKAATDLRSNETSGRGYGNTSVLVDAGISQREQDSRRFSESLRAQMQAQEDANKATMQGEGNLARMRYALYDVGNALGVVGLGLTGMTVAIAGTSIAYEREFAQVRRTVGVTGESANALYDDFVQLSTQIPTTFADLSEIGAMAGQLGILEGRVGSFTKTVAQFSATTDVSVDASATAFGRLDQLIDGVDGQYGKLASSILNVGINSVATESSIISIASQIAATGNQAGLTADEIVGLSGSLASLGIAPEAARGTILRVFSQINTAVASGGETLNDFANVSGMSAQTFKDSWGSDFTTTFVALLDGINNSAGGAQSALSSLGITAARDQNALLKLSQNSGAVARDLELAASGFASTAVLTDNFGIVSETTSAKLQMLASAFQGFIASIGEGTAGPLGHFADLAIDLLKVLTDLSNNPAAQWVGAFGVAITGTIAVLALLAAAAARASGTVLALKTAIGETALQSTAAQGGIKGLGATLLGATGAANAFGAALKATGVGLLITGGLWAVSEAIGAISTAMASGKDQSTEYFGSLDGLSEAIKADNAAVFATRIEEAKTAVDGIKVSSDDWVGTLEEAAAAQSTLNENTGGSTSAIDIQTLSIGKNSEEWMRNTLASNEHFRAIFENMEQLKQLEAGTQNLGGTEVSYEAFDMSAFAEQLISGGEAAGQAYIDNFKNGVMEAAQATGDVNVVNAAENFLANNTALEKAQEAGQQVGNAYTEGIASAAAVDSLKDALGIPDEVGESAEDAASSFRNLVNDIYGVVNAEAELSSAMNQLGADFVNNGATVAASGSNMQAVIAAIYASSSGAPQAAARMQGLFDSLVAGGYASATQLSGLQAIIASLAGGKAVKPIQVDMSGFTSGLNKATVAAAGKSGKGNGGTAKAIRTLVDYANDLQKVFSRSFDIRFGGEQGADQITQQWNDMRRAIAEANEDIAESIQKTNQALRDYQTETTKLTSDKAIAQYWLSVAEAYGDSLRAGGLRADILGIDDKLASSAADLAKTQADAARDVAKAQEVSNKTLVGNSDVAIANRAQILGLVGDYQSYIAKLAESGMSQADLQRETTRLKQEFMAQATQLGYNQGELGKYARAFDDVTTAINKVPRNITVAVNPNPALQAIAEIQAKLNAAANGSYRPQITPQLNDAASRKAARGDLLGAEIALLRNKIESRSPGMDGGATLRRIGELSALLNSGGYRKGGWTGGGNPANIAGVTHKREFVLNETGAQMMPMSALNAMNQGRAPQLPMAVKRGGRGGSGTGYTELSPTDRALLSAIRDNIGVTIGSDAVAGATSASNIRNARQGRG